MTLLWDSQTDRLFIALEQNRSGGPVELEVRGADPLEAIRHPYVYASGGHACARPMTP